MPLQYLTPYFSPNANKGRKTPSDSDLTAEAVFMLLVEMDTTANALVVGTWEILHNIEVYSKSREEYCKTILLPFLLSL